MAKIRKDTKGRVLHRGEDYLKKKRLYRYSFTDQLKKRRCIYAKDLPELREKIKKLKRDQLDGIDTYSRGRSDIDSAFDRYMSTKTKLRVTTRLEYLYQYDHYIRNGFGKKKISDVCFSDIVLFYSDLVNQGLEFNTVNQLHKLLHPTFQLAVRDNLIRTNPALGAMHEIYRGRDVSKSTRHALTLEQEQAFLEELDKPINRRWKSIFTVMFGTGCRIGEVVALRWDDVDFENGLISIKHSAAAINGRSGGSRYEVFSTKTQAGVRTIPMLSKVREVLEQQYSMHEEYGNPCHVTIGGLTDFVFCGNRGNLLDKCSLNRVIKRIVLEHNAEEAVNAEKENRQPIIIPHFTCHTARHTFCTRLCENDTNIKVIQSVMGHRDIKTTLDVYAEISEKKKQEVFLQLNEKDIV